MTSFVVPPEKLNISDRGGVLTTYQFGSYTAKHHFCANCGIHVFVETRMNPGCYRINLGCVDDLEIFDLPRAVYPGREI